LQQRKFRGRALIKDQQASGAVVVPNSNLSSQFKKERKKERKERNKRKGRGRKTITLQVKTLCGF
jgi:hypothetical protein